MRCCGGEVTSLHARANSSLVELAAFVHWAPGRVQDDPLKSKPGIRTGKEGDLSDSDGGPLIGLSEPVASLQFPHLATSRGCAEWFRKEKISSEQRFSGPQCFANARGQRRKGRRPLLLL